MGIVGKTNVGKSTFFKALTLANVEISNRVFTTIEANHGIGFVKTRCHETKINTRCHPSKGYCLEGWRFVPVELLDVAGLVPGAHEGRGLGLRFLDDLRQADVLIHVVDASGSTNEEGEPVKPGTYDPANDIRFLEKEMSYWFFDLIKRGWAKVSKEVELMKKELVPSLSIQFSGLKIGENKIKKALEAMDVDIEKPSRWSDDELKRFAFSLLRSSKPFVIAANKIDIPEAKDILRNLQKEFPEHTIIPCSSEGELILKEASKQGFIKYIPGEGGFEIVAKDRLNEKQLHALRLVEEKILEPYGSTGVQQAIDKAVFEKLGYIVVYPVANINRLTDKKGNVLPDAFLVKRGTTLKEFAAKIHSEFAEKFIGGIDFETKRKLGGDYELKDGDIVEIVFGR